MIFYVAMTLRISIDIQH